MLQYAVVPCVAFGVALAVLKYAVVPFVTIGPHSHEIRDVVSDRSSDSALFGTSFVVGIPTVVKKGTVPHTNNRNN